MCWKIPKDNLLANDIADRLVRLPEQVFFSTYTTNTKCLKIKFIFFAVETCLADAKCYEIPVDSFETPQRIYIDGVRVTPLSDALETPVSQRSLFQTAADVNIVDQTQYCAATKRGSVSTDGQRESITSSVGPGTHYRQVIHV